MGWVWVQFGHSGHGLHDIVADIAGSAPCPCFSPQPARSSGVSVPCRETLERLGNIDRDAGNIPIISPATGRHAKTGLPTADVTGQGGFCTLEDVRGQGLGYEFLIRFFLRATGALAVTVRTAEVEQMFCTSEAGGAITFADLNDPNPEFVEVSLDEVAKVNPLVRQIVR